MLKNQIFVNCKNNNTTRVCVFDLACKSSEFILTSLREHLRKNYTASVHKTECVHVFPKIQENQLG